MKYTTECNLCHGGTGQLYPCVCSHPEIIRLRAEVASLKEELENCQRSHGVLYQQLAAADARAERLSDGVIRAAEHLALFCGLPEKDS